MTSVSCLGRKLLKRVKAPPGDANGPRMNYEFCGPARDDDADDERETGARFRKPSPYGLCESSKLAGHCEGSSGNSRSYFRTIETQWRYIFVMTLIGSFY